MGASQVGTLCASDELGSVVERTIRLPTRFHHGRMLIFTNQGDNSRISLTEKRGEKRELTDSANQQGASKMVLPTSVLSQ